MIGMRRKTVIIVNFWSWRRRFIWRCIHNPQHAELFEDEEEEVEEEQSEGKNKKDVELAEEKVGGQAKNKKVGKRGVAEMVELSGDSDDGGEDISKNL